MWAGRRGLCGELDGGEFVFRALGFLGDEGFASVEMGFGEVAEEAEAGFDGAAVWREVVAVEGVCHFEAEGVAGAEAAGGGSGGDEFFKSGDAEGCGGEEFVAVLASVAGAAEDFPGCEGGDVIARWEGFGGEEFGENGGGFGALDGEAGPLVGLVLEGDAGCEVFFHPCVILGDHGGVDDEEVGVFGGAVGDEVVDDAAVLVEEEGVVALAGGEFFEVVGEDGVKPCGGVFAGDDDLAHVGDVEDAGFLADGGVLAEDGAVLDGHVPAGEGDEAGAEGQVGGFEG